MRCPVGSQELVSARPPRVGVHLLGAGVVADDVQRPVIVQHAVRAQDLLCQQFPQHVKLNLAILSLPIVWICVY